MKGFNQNRTRANGSGAGESILRPLLSSGRKPARRHYTRAGAAIFVIIVLHFVSQFIFFQSEKVLPKTEALNRQSVEIKPENKPEINKPETAVTAKKPEAAVSIPTVAPVVQPQPASAPSRIMIKKKEPRESKAERLRRAERLLTGI
ncbi:MAG: hypothetical protein M3384_16090 [Acidobacteriota bacterium]|nr:hypothetical protein [Acidobacteriota bacterium]